MAQDTMANRWLVCELAMQKFAIPAAYITEIIKMRGHKLWSVPGQPRVVRGVTLLRQQSVPIVDLRLVLGMPSLNDQLAEIIDILDGREQDHVNWLRELESSAVERREFRLATDPHKCGFGKWYDKLMGDERALHQLTDGNMVLIHTLQAFDGPHQRIHGIALQVEDLVKQGKSDEALAMIEATRKGDLGAMIRLFESARQMFQELRQPAAVIVQHDGRPIGLQVDSVDNVTIIDPERTLPVPTHCAHDSQSVSGIARTDTALISMVDMDKLFCEMGLGEIACGEAKAAA
ncbi:MAG: chemotaxis protein CheW [Phycisphaerales bacterium]|nr:chemotaxis protein CheW [Phycisphaerales bacterium]